MTGKKITQFAPITDAELNNDSLLWVVGDLTGLLYQPTLRQMKDLLAPLITPGWSLTGNIGTDPAINFIGTEDARPLLFRVNKVHAGEISVISGNVSLGIRTLSGLGIGINNVSLGSDNMTTLLDGNENIAIGTGILPDLKDGDFNIGIGARMPLALGIGNIAIGRPTGTLEGLLTGANNIAIGPGTLTRLTTGANNIAVGNAVLANINGNNNIGIGLTVASNLITGNNGIFIGTNTTAPLAAGDDQLNIANLIYSRNTAATPKLLGIGTSNPTASLHVVGNLRIGAYTFPATDGVSNQVLKTDGIGDLKWSNEAFADFRVTTGSILFGSTTGLITQDNPNLYWNDTTNRLSLGARAAGTPELPPPQEPDGLLTLWGGNIRVHGGNISTTRGGFYCAPIDGSTNQHVTITAPITRPGIATIVIDQPTMSVIFKYGNDDGQGGIRKPAQFTTGNEGILDIYSNAVTAGAFIGQAKITFTAAGLVRMIVDQGGRLALRNYGVGAITGTATRSLQVDAIGNVIEGVLSTLSGWNLTGNLGISAITNFIGTLDIAPINFRVNNQPIGNLGVNTAFGLSVLPTVSIGIGNIALGQQAGNLLTSGNYGIFIGTNVNAIVATGDWQLNIANSIYSRNTQVGNIGIGINDPQAKLHVSGNLRVGAYTLPSTDGTANQILKTNGAGVLTWQDDEEGAAGTNYIFASGLTQINAVEVNLGGELLRQTTITVGSQRFLITRSAVHNTAEVMLNVVDPSTPRGTVNYAALKVEADNNPPLALVRGLGVNNGVDTILNITKSSSSNTVNNVGASIDFHIKRDTTIQLANRVISRWTNVASQLSELSFTATTGGTQSTVFSIDGIGKARLHKYGVGTHTGTPAKVLQVDASGNIIENVPVVIEKLDGSTTLDDTLLILRKDTATTPVDGLGVSMDFFLNRDGTSPQFSGKIASKWVNIAATISELSFSTRGGSFSPEVFSVNGLGRARLHMYGGATPITGTPVKALNVDATGNVIEGDLALTISAVDMYSVFHNSFMGGGEYTFTANRDIKWTRRFISTAFPKSPEVPDGYFEILMPPDGTVIHGWGNRVDQTVANGVIALGSFDVLYYELPLGAVYNTNYDNFYISGHGGTGDTYDVPAHWVAVVRHNDDNDYVQWCNGDTTPGREDAWSVLHGSFVGGGLLTSQNNNIHWSQRFINISVAKGLAIPSGYFDIAFPPNGTVIKGLAGLANHTVANGVIGLGTFEVLWYELPLRANNITNNNNFYKSNYGNGNFSTPAHWVAVAKHSGDNDTVQWINGTQTNAGGQAGSYDWRGNSAWVNVPRTGVTAGILVDAMQCRFESFGTNVHLRGNISASNATVGGMPANGQFGVLDAPYRPVVGSYYNNDQPSVGFPVMGSDYTNLVGAPVWGYAEAETGRLAYFGHQPNSFSAHIDATWSVS